MSIQQPIRLADVTRMLMLSQKAETREAHALDYATWLCLLGHTRGRPTEASEIYQDRYPRTVGTELLTKSLELRTKAAVAPGTTTDPTWGGNLATPREWSEGFAAIAHSASVIGEISGLRMVPINTRIPTQTASAIYVWVGENTNKAVSKMAFNTGPTLGPTKSAGTVVVTKEFIQVISRGTAKALQDELVEGLNEHVDKSFLDPASTAIAGQRPGSITAGTTPVVGTADLVASVKALKKAFFAGRPGAKKPVLIANGDLAGELNGMVPGVGYPVIPNAAALTNVIMLDPAGVFVADGGVEIDYSEYASLQMDSAPANPADATTVLVNLWQINSVGYRVERTINFVAQTGAVKYMTTP